MVASVGERQLVEGRIVDDDPGSVEQRGAEQGGAGQRSAEQQGAEQLVVCVGLSAAQCVDIARALNGATVVVAADAELRGRAAQPARQTRGPRGSAGRGGSGDGRGSGGGSDRLLATVAPVAGGVADGIAGTDTTLPSPRRFIRHGPLSLDVDGREAHWHDRVLRLPGRELDLLVVLAADPGRASSFGELTERLWRRPYLGDPAAVISVVKRLRAHLRSDDVPLLVESVRGWGYRLTGWSGGPELDR